MTRMTDPARERLETYLDRVRRSLSACHGVDADEVAADVGAHVDDALEGASEPVSLERLEAVLADLGAPGRWVPPEEQGAIRRVVARLREGPDDWRLAYLCLGLTVLGILAAPIGGILLLIPAFVLARGSLSLAADRAEPVSAQRWLVYPALLLVYAVLLLVLLAAPIPLSPAVFATGGLVEFLGVGYPEPGTSAHWRASVGWTALGTGVWWSAWGGLAAARPAVVRAALRPFADRFRRRHAWWLILPGLVAAVAGLVLITLS